MFALSYQHTLYLGFSFSLLPLPFCRVLCKQANHRAWTNVRFMQLLCFIIYLLWLFHGRYLAGPAFQWLSSQFGPAFLLGFCLFCRALRGLVCCLPQSKDWTFTVGEMHSFWRHHITTTPNKTGTWFFSDVLSRSPLLLFCFIKFKEENIACLYLNAILLWYNVTVASAFYMLHKFHHPVEYPEP